MILPFAVKVQPEVSTRYARTEKQLSLHSVRAYGPAGQDEGYVIEKESEMSHPLEEKGHGDPWAPGKVAAAGIQVRETLRG